MCPSTDFAVLSRVAVGAGAAILIRLRVHAGPAVQARVVTPTVIQICTQNRLSQQGIKIPPPQSLVRHTDASLARTSFTHSTPIFQWLACDRVTIHRTGKNEHKTIAGVRRVRTIPSLWSLTSYTSDA